jgi:hypothetical protein
LRTNNGPQEKDQHWYPQEHMPQGHILLSPNGYKGNAAYCI